MFQYHLLSVNEYCRITHKIYRKNFTKVISNKKQGKYVYKIESETHQKAIRITVALMMEFGVNRSHIIS